MFVRFWGVRGSYPVPGAATNRFGGNTACVQVCPDDGTVLVIDAGTGIRKLGQRLVDGDAADSPLACGEGTVHLLISHMHWDHIQGLPFFAPLYTKGNRINIYARQRDVHLRTLFSSQTQDPYFPVSLDDVAATVDYRELIEGSRFAIDEQPIDVRCARLNHPYIAVGYRIEADGGSVAYVSDTAPFDRILLGYEFISNRPDADRPPTGAEAEQLAEIRRGVLELCAGADLVIYDTMFVMDEYEAFPHWGHSAPEHALEIVEEAGAHCLALYHHHPSRTDEQQRAVVEQMNGRTGVEVIGAAEGMEVVCAGGRVEVRD